MNGILKILAVWWCLVACTFASASARSFAFRALSVSDGLPDLVVNSIYKDSRGFVWMGTNVSLERFDGVRLKHYFLEGSEEKQKRVYAIVETHVGEIWAGTARGLYRVNEGRGKLERVAPDLIDSEVHALYAAGDTVYIGSVKGLYFCAEGRFGSVRIDGNVFSPSNHVTGIDAGDEGVLWLSTMGGLKSLSPADGKVTAYPSGSGSGSAEKAFYNVASVGGQVFLGTMTEGIVAFDPETGAFRPYVDVGCSVVSSLSSDKKDLLYVGTDGNGVHFISVSSEKIVRSFRHEIRDKTSIRSNSVYSVLVDREGLLWIGFYQLGVDYTLFQNDVFRVYRYGSRFTTEDMPVRTIAFHGSQKLIGSRDGFVFIDEAAHRFKSFRMPQLRAGIIISSCYFEGRYYIGTYGGGMYVLDPNTLELGDFNPGDAYPFRSGHVFCIRPDSEGCLWVGTSDGVYRFKDGKKVSHFTSAGTKLPEGNVYEIFFDSSRKGWICTESGMCIWNPSTSSLQTNVFPEGFVHGEKVRMIYEASDHRLLFLLEKGELFVSDLSLEEYGYVGRGTLLDGKNLMSVIEDDEGNLWITTNNGVYRCDSKGGIVPFGVADGMPSNVFINCFAIKDSEGTLWFGNSRGLVFLPGGSARRLSEWPYPVAVSGLLVDGVDKSDALEREGTHYRILLDASSRSASLLLSDLVYTFPGNTAYEYRREGDDEWVSLVGKSELVFYELSGKNCRYHVRRIGYPDSAVTVDVSFLPSHGAAWWLSAAFFLFLALAAYFFRKRLACFLRREKKSVAAFEPEVPAAFLIGEDTEAQQEDVSPADGGKPSEKQMRLNAKTLQDDKYGTNKLSAEECKRLYGQLEATMRERKPYISPDLKVADLAVMVGSTSHALSYLFNQYLHKSYYDYVNDFRIREFKTIVTTQDCSKYTLEALAELCGFSSRASFFRSFKKATGITPNEYIKSVQK